MESKALPSVINLVSNSGIGLERLLEYRVTQECLSIFNVYGMSRKVQKSKLMASFTLHDIGWPHDYIALIDMGMILRLATPTSDQRAKVNGTPYTWEAYAKHCVDIVMSLQRL